MAGSVPVAVLAVVLMLTLAAGVSSRAAKLMTQTAPPDGAPRSEVDPGPLRLPAVPPRADGEPAIERAAEAGLARMRVQFAQSLQVAPEGLGAVGAEAAASVALSGARLRGGAPAADPAPGAPAPDPRAPETSTAGPSSAGAPPGGDARLQRRPLRLPGDDRLLRYGPPAEGSVTLVGEATVLIRSHGITVLTDPNFLRRGEPARLAPMRSVARRADPALDLDELPPVDVVVLSRLREDHFDRLSRRRLPRDLPIVAPASARSALVAMGFSSVHALEDWGTLRIERGDATLVLTATPTRVGPRGLASLLPASMGTLMAFGTGGEPPAYRIWVSGDTTIDDALMATLRPRLGDLDLALLHVGGTAVFGLGGSMDAADGLRAVAALGPRTAIPLRLDDFAEPTSATAVLRAQTVAARAQPADGPRIRLLERGDVHRFAPLQHWALAADEAPAAR